MSAVLCARDLQHLAVKGTRSPVVIPMFEALVKRMGEIKCHENLQSCLWYIVFLSLYHKLLHVPVTSTQTMSLVRLAQAGSHQSSTHHGANSGAGNHPED